MKLRLAAGITAGILCVLLAAPRSQNQEYDRRDGNWWRGINRENKAFYLAGFVDGMQLGNRFSVWGVDKNEKDSKQVSTQVTSSFSDYRAKYLANVTNIQLSDGLDSFYSDSRNRRIVVNDAVWLVLNEISGAPEAVLQPLIDASRKNADTQ